MIAEVIVDIAHSDVDRVFDYVASDDICLGDRVLVPFGRQQVEGFVISLKEKSDLAEGKLKTVLRRLDSCPALVPENRALFEFIVRRYHSLKAPALRLFIPSEMRGGRVKKLTRKFVYASSGLTLEDVLPHIRKNATAQIGVLEAVYSEDGLPLAELTETFSASAVSALERAGFVEVRTVRKERTPYGAVWGEKKQLTLTKAQKEAVETIDQYDGTVLLHGVTGSGKTEIYLNCIERALARGKTAIFLVPEISLTPQMLGALRTRFGETVAILHSGLSAGERFDEWWRLRDGRARIAVGARSAIFAPLENVGIIVIDEEHDTSYLSETAPRYATLEVAEERRRLSGATLVLGSATPSVETYHRAKQGEMKLIHLPERINKRKMPEFIVADMRRELAASGRAILSDLLIAELKSCLEKGNQAMLFLNRRGFASIVRCTDCGYVATCADCDVSLTYHKDENALKCHYCGASYAVPTVCPECGKTCFKQSGIGTERIVSEIEALFPGVKILRMDNDTTRTKEGHAKILSAFANGEAQVLVGTQMIAKGHDFPNVTLVGIVDADMSLYHADFRSGERTFQLITQVAGRAGRADREGKVVLQTYSPKNHVLRFAMRYDYAGFYEYEINLRQATLYPPFSRIVKVMTASEDDSLANEAIKRIYYDLKKVKEKYPDSFAYLNAMRAPVKRVQGNFRYQIIARLAGDAVAACTDAIYEACERYQHERLVSYVEVNPNSMT